MLPWYSALYVYGLHDLDWRVGKFLSIPNFPVPAVLSASQLYTYE